MNQEGKPPAQPVSPPPAPQTPQVINIQPQTQAPPQVAPPPPPPAPSPPSLGSQKAAIAQKLEILTGVIFGTIETSLTFRLFFKLFGANPSNRFVNGLYQFTDIFVSPFVGVFNLHLSFENFVLDIPTIIAMIIYSLIGYGLWWVSRLL